MTDVPDFVEARRSIRQFTAEPVHSDVLDACVRAACLAPAPHHSRPWRWVTLGQQGRERLADGMAEAWRHDLMSDGVAEAEIDRLSRASIERITAAPAAVLGCLIDDGLDHYPDPTRQRAENGMALLSLGAGVENMMLTAADHGLGSCWIAAPIFCPRAARAALSLDSSLRPQALVLLGWPHPDYEPMTRTPVELERYRIER